MRMLHWKEQWRLLFDYGERILNFCYFRSSVHHGLQLSPLLSVESRLASEVLLLFCTCIELSKMMELRSPTVDPLPKVAPTAWRVKGAVKRPPRQKVNEELGLDFPLTYLQGSEVWRNGQVLLPLSHFLQEGQGEQSVINFAELTVESVKRCWFGSNVKMAWDKTLTRQILTLYKYMRYINGKEISNGWLSFIFNSSCSLFDIHPF